MWRPVLEAIFGQEEVRAVGQAPLAFIFAVFAATLITSALIYWALRWKYSTVMEHKTSQNESLQTMLKLRDDQLSNKFQSTPPDEAMKMIEALKAQVVSISPRRIPSDKIASLQELARVPKGQKWSVFFRIDGLAFDGARLAVDLSSLLRDAGWEVDGRRDVGGDRVVTNIVLWVKNSKKLSQAERALDKLLKQSTLAYSTYDGDSEDQKIGLPIVEIGHLSAD